MYACAIAITTTLYESFSFFVFIISSVLHCIWNQYERIYTEPNGFIDRISYSMQRIKMEISHWIDFVRIQIG